MRTPPGTYATATVSAVALGCLGAVAIATPARADRFSASYTCTLPLLGARPITIAGTLAAAPNPTTVGTATRFLLAIAGLSLRSPITINYWTATAQIDVDGAQNASFHLRGGGRTVLPRQPINGRLAGTWTPRAPGIARLRGGPVTIKLNVALFGDFTVPCAPKGERPVLATLNVDQGAAARRYA